MKVSPVSTFLAGAGTSIECEGKESIRQGKLMAGNEAEWRCE